MESKLRRKIITNELGQISSQNFSEQISKYLNGKIIPSKAGITKNNHKESWLRDNRISLCLLAFARLASAVWNPISDCDETYNFWEPLHYLLFGSGLQTWEYSPAYAIHSYAYIVIHAFPAWVFKLLFTSNKITIFYFVRVLLVCFSTVSEMYFYKGVKEQFGPKVANLTFFSLLYSAGMFQSSSALLACSFSMYMCFISIGAWYQRHYSLAIMATAVSTFLSWPYAGVTGVGIAIDLILFKKERKIFVKWCLISIVTVLMPIILIDSYYYGRFVIASLNTVLYNVFSDRGPDLFGTSPWTYYFLNGFLNFNFIFPLALVALPAFLVTIHLEPFGRQHGSIIWTTFLTFYLWISIFFKQPHKEERFLFPIYPLLGLAAAISWTCVESVFRALKLPEQILKFLTIFLLVSSAVISLSRIVFLHKRIHVHIDVFLELNHLSDKGFKDSQLVGPNVCMGKQSFDFPSSFFLPKQMKLLYLESGLQGQLPRHFDPPPNGTWIVPLNMNDRNLEEPSRYSIEMDCHYLVDQVLDQSSETEPAYHLKTKEWEIIFLVDRINNLESPQILKSFYVPWLSQMYCKKNPYMLLQRSPSNKKK